MSTVKLRIRYADGRTEDREFGTGRYRLGRDTGDVVLGDPNTSAVHAELDIEPPLVRLTDVGSTNGTFDVSGTRLSTQYLMRAGEPLRMGSTQLTLLAPQPEKGGTQVMAQVPVAGIGSNPTGYGPSPSASASPYGPAPSASAPPYGAPPGTSASPYGPAPSASAPPYGAPPGTSASPYGPAPSASAPPYGAPPGPSASPYGPPPAGDNPSGAPYGYGAAAFAPGGGGGAGFGFGPPSPNHPPLTMDYALWPNRVIGYLIDYALVLVVMGLMYGIFTAIQLLLLSAATVGSREANAAGGLLGGTCCIGLVLFPLATLAIGLWNRVYLVSKRGYSIGQGFCRLRVVDAAGQRLTFGTAFLRLLAQVVLSMLPFGLVLDMLWPLFDERRQTLHDKAVNCFVINAPA